MLGLSCSPPHENWRTGTPPRQRQPARIIHNNRLCFIRFFLLSFIWDSAPLLYSLDGSKVPFVGYFYASTTLILVKSRFRPVSGLHFRAKVWRDI
jgi:hypothetical protein